MCGVVGFVDKKRKLSDGEKSSLMEKMLSEIEYRGRDNRGVFMEGPVCIGHNRLSILDSSKEANQPYVQGQYVTSYNGEIFNHQELRKLENNHTYKTHSDIETFAVIFKKLKTEIFPKISGMFAVSIYDVANKEVITAIDRFGIKPLYYIDTSDWYAWASELKVFKHLPGVTFTVNASKLFEYGRFRTTTGMDAVLQEVKKVRPAEILTYNLRNGKLAVDSYKKKHVKICDTTTEDMLKTSVLNHLLSDAPIGLQLSGGVDSSLISVLAGRQSERGAIHSFSIGLRDPNWNEFKYSREVATQLKTQHHELEFNQDDFCKYLPIATYHLDEPLS